MLAAVDSPSPSAPRALRLSRPGRRWTRADFERPTLTVARALLGTFVCTPSERGAFITEVEAYKGPHDLACHARKGRRTPRVEPLYGAGGTLYVYFVYGMHWMLNFSSAGREKPEAVLVRALCTPTGTRIIGPGRVARHLALDRRHDGLDATRTPELWLEDRNLHVPPRLVHRGPRIGIDFAGPYWAARPWRFRVEKPELLLAAHTARSST